MGIKERAGWRVAQVQKEMEQGLEDLARFIGYKIEEELQSLAPQFKNHIIIAEDGYCGIEFHFFKRSAFPDKIHLNHDRWIEDLMYNEVGSEYHTLYEAGRNSRGIPLLKSLDEIHDWHLNLTVLGHEIQLPEVGVSGDFEPKDLI